MMTQSVDYWTGIRPRARRATPENPALRWCAPSEDPKEDTARYNP